VNWISKEQYETLSKEWDDLEFARDQGSDFCGAAEAHQTQIENQMAEAPWIYEEVDGQSVLVSSITSEEYEELCKEMERIEAANAAGQDTIESDERLALLCEISMASVWTTDPETGKAVRR